MPLLTTTHFSPLFNFNHQIEWCSSFDNATKKGIYVNLLSGSAQLAVKKTSVDDLSFWEDMQMRIDSGIKKH